MVAKTKQNPFIILAKTRQLVAKLTRHPFVTIGIVVVILVFIVFTFAVYTFGWDWTGFNGEGSKITITSVSRGSTIAKELQPARTLWDWLGLLAALAVPVVVGFGVAWFTMQQGKVSVVENKDNQRENVLQLYIDNMSNLVIEKHLLDLKPEYDEVRKIARVRTLTVFPRLDSERKRSVLQFLYESSLLAKDSPIIDLRGANLREANLRGANLGEVNLSGAYLGEANLGSTDLHGANLRGANLGGANLEGAHLRGADLSKAYLFRAHGFERPTFPATLWAFHIILPVDMRETNLSEANLSNANLSGAYLSGADLSHANLSGADLSHANLSGTNLSKASLVGADLSEANLSNANLGGAILSSAILHGADLRKTILSGAYMYRTDLSSADLSGADLSGADLYVASMQGKAPGGRSFSAPITLRGTDVDLSEADLRRVLLERHRPEAPFKKINLDLSEADVSNVNLTESNLREAVISASQLKEVASLKNAIMPDGSKHP